MGILDIFSKRQKFLKGDFPKIYQHDDIPNKLRVQIGHIFLDIANSEIYQNTHKILCKEYGRYTLDANSNSHQEAILQFLVNTKKVEEVLDVIEVLFTVITDYNSSVGSWDKIVTVDAIEEINQRFKENGVGYFYDNNMIIRIDSTYVHNEITIPAISLLYNKKFWGAGEEYLAAHTHYKEGRNKECLNDCLKAFESTLKTICTEKSWDFGTNDTAKKLIQICFQNGLVPSFTQNQFTSLQNLLESGVPTIRNKMGGHGQGPIPQRVNNEMARYALNLTGTNIIFLVEQSGI